MYVRWFAELLTRTSSVGRPGGHHPSQDIGVIGDELVRADAHE
jgi:hypothetical protein